jgi:excisionase family DNA binding protein
VTAVTTTASPHAEPTAQGVIDLLEAARILGIGRTLAYRLVRDGRWPTPVIRVGRLIKVPVAPLNEYLRDPKATVA